MFDAESTATPEGVPNVAAVPKPLANPAVPGLLAEPASVVVVPDLVAISVTII